MSKCTNVLTPLIGQHLQWKQHLQVDTIIDEFEPPEVLRKYYPGGLVGHDKQGCPVWIVPLGSLDIKGLLHSAKKTDFVRYTVKCLQESEEDMKNQSERVSLFHAILWPLARDDHFRAGEYVLKFWNSFHCTRLNHNGTRSFSIVSSLAVRHQLKGLFLLYYFLFQELSVSFPDNGREERERE